MNGSTATISYLARRWTLTSNDRITVGRGSACTVQLPNDGHISRLAVAIELIDGTVLVRNESASKPIVIRPPAGEDHVVVPQAAVSPPYPRFSIVLAGSRGDESVEVEASSSRPAAGSPVTSSAETFTGPGRFTAAQHRVMVELCRPLLIGSGAAARPATYAEIGERLDLSPQYVRNVLKMIRESLSGYGIAGLVADDDSANDFRLPLARWALWNGHVSRTDLGDCRGE